MQPHTSHDPVTVTERDGEERRPSTGGEESHWAALQSALGDLTARSHAIDLRPEKALVIWYRLGLTVPNLCRPKGFAFAYRLGRRMAVLRRRET